MSRSPCLGAHPPRRPRDRLKQIAPLRSLYHLARSVGDILSTRPGHVADDCEAIYRRGADPWRYESEDQQARYARALGLIRTALGATPSAKVIEIGCGEGMFTALLAPYCAELVAADASPTALDRARARLGGAPQVRFRTFDVLTSPLESGFDLIVMDHIIDLFGRRAAYRKIATLIANAMTPDGYALIGAMRAFDAAETAWWSRYVPWGGVAILDWIGRHTPLTPVTSVTESFYTYTLFRRRT